MRFARSLAIVATLAFSGTVQAQNVEDTLNIKLDDGTVRIQLRPDLAPKHVEQIKILANRGFYDGIVFHRVIDGFMAQTGDPTGTGTGGSDLPDIPAEFTRKEKFERGTVGMARAQDPNSANSQFFIMFDDAPFLDGQYTIVGEVTEGMEFVDKIKRGNGPNGIVATNPDKMVDVTVGELTDASANDADAPKE